MGSRLHDFKASSSYRDPLISATLVIGAECLFSLTRSKLFIFGLKGPSSLMILQVKIFKRL